MSKLSEIKVSVVMPARDTESTIAEAAESILSQTLRELELVIVDDGSCDGTLRIAEELRRRDERVRVIARPRAGLTAALNAGLAEAGAPLIARMDADDISLPERLYKQRRFLAERPEIDLVSCLVRSFPPEMAGEGMAVYEEWLNSIVTEEEIERDFFVESPFAHPSVVFRKAAAIAAGGYADNGWPEDYDLWMRMRRKGARFGKIPEELFLWRDSAGRLSRTGDAYSAAAFRSLKLHYLLQNRLAGVREVSIWGAGRIGRWWLKEFIIAGLKVSAMIDVDPKKIGRSIGSVPVVPPEAVESPLRGELVLGCVGSRGAREKIRACLLEMGFNEQRDFMFLA